MSISFELGRLTAMVKTADMVPPLNTNSSPYSAQPPGRVTPRRAATPIYRPPAVPAAKASPVPIYRPQLPPMPQHTFSPAGAGPMTPAQALPSAAYGQTLATPEAAPQLKTRPAGAVGSPLSTPATRLSTKNPLGMGWPRSAVGDAVLPAHEWDVVKTRPYVGVQGSRLSRWLAPATTLRGQTGIALGANPFQLWHHGKRIFSPAGTPRYRPSSGAIEDAGTVAGLVKAPIALPMNALLEAIDWARNGAPDRTEIAGTNSTAGLGYDQSRAGSFASLLPKAKTVQQWKDQGVWQSLKDVGNVAARTAGNPLSAAKFLWQAGPQTAYGRNDALIKRYEKATGKPLGWYDKYWLSPDQLAFKLKNRLGSMPTRPPVRAQQA